MNPEQLSALFTQHRTAVLGGAAVLVVGLGLYSRKVKAPAAAGATTGGATVPGTIPAAAVAPTGGYDSTATDVYQALSDQIGALEQQQQTTGTAVTAPSKPISSTLFAPTGTGQYVVYKNGAYGEIESDGSVYGLSTPELTPDQWSKVWGAATPIGTTQTNYFDRATNLAAQVQPAKS